MSLSTGTQLGPYEILGTLGSGGMGEIYRARDRRLEREVAIKVLPERTAKDPEALGRLQREAKALAALSHRSILTVFDVGNEHGVSFLVTELLDGETLHEKIRHSPLSWMEALQIAISVAEGLGAAHSRGVIHRDLKPENVIVTQNGSVKLVDFGLARFEKIIGSEEISRAHTLAKTSPGVLIGTVQYMSPEQVRGLIADARSDLFSFGCLLYEMLTGSKPFSGNNLVEVLTSILRDPVPELRVLNPNIPSSLEQIILACLHKNPEDRIQTARELIIALKAVESGSAVWSHPSEKPKKRRAQRKKTIDSLAILPFANAVGDQETEYLCDGLTDAIIRSLSPLPRLRVMARATVFRYKGRDVDPLLVGRELNVRAVLTGRAVTQAESFAIQTELVDVMDGSRIWGDEYSCEFCNILELQTEIASEISEQLRLKLLQKEKKRLGRKYTENTEAYRVYLQGRYFWNKRTRDGFLKSIEYFEQAIQQDPKFPLAYVGLADAYSLLGGFGYAPAKATYSKAKMEAIKALDLDPTLAEAHTSLAVVKYRMDWDWKGAEQSFLQAIRYNPGYATAHHWYGVYLTLMGRFEEGLVEVDKGLDLDPLSLVLNWARGYVFYYMRRYDDAIREYRKTLGIDPTFSRVHTDIGLTYVLNAQFQEGIEEIQKGMAFEIMNPGILASLGYAYGIAGDREEATRILEELLVYSKRNYLSPFAMALVHVGLGNLNQAFDWLQKSIDEREDAVASIRVNPRLDPIRSDSRYDGLIRQLRFPAPRSAKS